MTDLPYWMKAVLSRDKKSRVIQLLQTKREFANKLCQTEYNYIIPVITDSLRFSSSEIPCKWDCSLFPQSQSDSDPDKNTTGIIMQSKTSDIDSSTQQTSINACTVERSNQRDLTINGNIPATKNVSLTIDTSPNVTRGILRTYSLFKSECRELPAKEVLPQGGISSTDDCKNLFKKIQYRINECRDLVNDRDSAVLIMPISQTDKKLIDGEDEADLI